MDTWNGINLPDGEYHTKYSIPILVKDKRILNAVPHHHQVSTMAYAPLPTPGEMSSLHQISAKLVPSKTSLANPGYRKGSPSKLILDHQRRTDDQHSDLLEKTEEIHHMAEKLKEDLIDVKTDLEDRLKETVDKICAQFNPPATSGLTQTTRSPINNDYNRAYVYKGDSDPSIPPWLFLHHRLREILDCQEFAPLLLSESQRVAHLQCIDAVLLTMKELLTQFNLCDDGQSKGLYLGFEKTVHEFLEKGTISYNDVVNFVQQILYLDQCELEKGLIHFELELQTGLLAQCFYKEWDFDDTDDWHPRDLFLSYPGVDRIKDKFFHRLKFVRLQSCICDSHKHDPLKRSQPNVSREIPTFRTIMTMAFGKDWTIGSLNNIRTYVNVLKNWIFASLFSYMTPYFPPYMKNGCREIADEIHFTSDEKKLFRTHTGAKDDYFRVMQCLTMAKKTSCTCDMHHVTRVFFYFFKSFWADTCSFLGPLVPLFWISGDISSGFQSQSGFCLIRYFCGGECNVHSPRFTSGATLADLLAAGAVLSLMNLLKVTEIDGPFGAIYLILAIMVQHAPIGYTFTVTVDACLQDDFDSITKMCVKYVYCVQYDINTMFQLTLCDELDQENHTCSGVLACVNNLDHISDHSVNG